MRFSCLGRAIVRFLSAALILFSAGLAAGGVMLLLLIVVDVIMALVSAPNVYQGGFLVGIIAIPFWLVGAFVVGPPLWAALHFAGLQGRRTAHVAGTLTGSIAVPAILWVMIGGGPNLSLDSLVGLIVLSAVGGFSGAVAGEAIHHLAYRPGETEHAR